MEVKLHNSVVYSNMSDKRKRNRESQTFQNSSLLFLFLGLKLIIIFFSSEKKRSRSLMGKVRTGCFVISNF